MREPENGLGVLLIDAGIAAGCLGLISLIRPLPRLRLATRGRSAALMAAGAALGLAGIALPAPARRVSARVSRLDRIIPLYQFSEFHEIRIQASPLRVYAAVRAVTAGDIRLFQALTWIRSPRFPGRDTRRESILNAPPEKPILDVATSSGFMALADEPGREVVVGMLVIAPPGGRDLRTPDDFIDFDAPGTAKAVMNFRMTDEGAGWTHLTTETRVRTIGASARRRFAAYWRLIYPGSSFIRREWLRAIRKRAEASPRSE